MQPFAWIAAPVRPAGAPKIVDHEVPAPASVPRPVPRKLTTSLGSMVPSLSASPVK